jgi:hypothetical protein
MTDVSSVGKAVEEPEFSHGTNGNINEYHHFKTE